MNLNITTTVFGDSYLTFLYALIGSLEQNIVNYKLYVFYKDINVKNIEKIQSHRIDFIDLNSIKFKNISTINHLISSKIYLWREALNYLPDGETVIFLDTDTIINKNPINSLDFDFNILFTIKNERFPINTGVIIVKNNLFTKSFIDKWAARTIEIIEDENLLDIAISKRQPYGGADQMSFYEMVNFNTYENPLIAQKSQNKIFTLECSKFNQTNSVKVDKDTFIYHFKGAWHNVIINGGTFTFKRNFMQSKEMLIMFNRHLSYFSRNFNFSNNYTKLSLNYFDFEKNSINYFKYYYLLIFNYLGKVKTRLINLI